MDLIGFWSYVHADDEVEMGGVTQLAQDIVGHYEAIKAEKIQLFLDRDDLHWGDQWRGKIDETLANVAFFIPVITPRYFTSVECRREFQFFAGRAEALHIRELILPILFIDVPELLEDEPSDPLMRQLKEIQWEPWAQFRFAERTSGQYRAAVDSLAQELVRRVATVERADVVAAVESAEEALAAGDAEAGTLDRIAALEEAMPRWSETLVAMSKEIERIGAIMERGTADMQVGQNMGKGFAARLTVARRVASELGGPVQTIETLGQEFASGLADIDSGVRVLLEEGREQAQQSEDPEALVQFCGFVESIRSLSVAANEGLGSVQGMITASMPLEKMSKDMRIPLRRLRSSLTAMVEAREITDAWVSIIEGLDIDCAGFPAQA